MKNLWSKSPELKLGVENFDKYAPFLGNNPRCSSKGCRISKAIFLFFLHSILLPKKRNEKMAYNICPGLLKSELKNCFWDFATFRNPEMFFTGLHEKPSSFEIILKLCNRIFHLHPDLSCLNFNMYILEDSNFFRFDNLYFILQRFREKSLNYCAVYRNNKIEKMAMFTLLIGLRIRHDSGSKMFLLSFPCHFQTLLDSFY